MSTPDLPPTPGDDAPPPVPDDAVAADDAPPPVPLPGDDEPDEPPPVPGDEDEDAPPNSLPVLGIMDDDTKLAGFEITERRASQHAEAMLADLPVAKKDGWLQRKKAMKVLGKTVWEKLYAVLDPELWSIRFFESEMDYFNGEEAGEIPLQKLKLVAHMPEKQKGKRFNITDFTGQEYHLLGESLDDALEWVNLVKQYQVAPLPRFSMSSAAGVAPPADASAPAQPAAADSTDVSTTTDADTDAPSSAADVPAAAADDEKADVVPQVIVMCPKCNETLLPPSGAPIFSCTCGTVLSAPVLPKKKPPAEVKESSSFKSLMDSLSKTATSKPAKDKDAKKKKKGKGLGKKLSKFFSGKKKKKDKDADDAAGDAEKPADADAAAAAGDDEQPTEDAAAKDEEEDKEKEDEEEETAAGDDEKPKDEEEDNADADKGDDTDADKGDDDEKEEEEEDEEDEPEIKNTRGRGFSTFFTNLIGGKKKDKSQPVVPMQPSSGANLPTAQAAKKMPAPLERRFTDLLDPLTGKSMRGGKPAAIPKAKKEKKPKVKKAESDYVVELSTGVSVDVHCTVDRTAKTTRVLWEFTLDDAQNKVELFHGRVWGRRQIIVNGDQVHDSRILLDDGSLHPVEVGGKKFMVIIQAAAFTGFTYNLLPIRIDHQAILEESESESSDDDVEPAIPTGADAAPADEDEAPPAVPEPAADDAPPAVPEPAGGADEDDAPPALPE